MKILAIPDIHLGNKSFGKDSVGELNSRIVEQLNLLTFIENVAKENKVDKLIFLGDIFDYPFPDFRLINSFTKWILSIENQYSIDIIVGNHDFIRSGNKLMTALDIFDVINNTSVKLFKSGISSAKFDNFDIIYVPYTDRNQLNSKTNSEAIDFIKQKLLDLKSDNKKTLVYGHMSIEGSFYAGEISDEKNEVFIPKQFLIDNFDYVCFGHIHNFQKINATPPVFHLGSLNKHHFDDNDKWLALHDTDTNQSEMIKVPCRNMIDIKIDIPEDVLNTDEYVSDYIEAIKDNFNDAIVRVKIKLNSVEQKQIDRKFITNVLENKNIFSIAGITEQKYTVLIEQIDDDQEVDGQDKVSENLDHYKLVDVFLNNYSNTTEEFKHKLSNLCKEIIDNTRGLGKK